MENTARRVAALLKRQGSGEEDAEDGDRLRREDPWLSTLYVASVTGRIATGEHAGSRVHTGGDRVDPGVMDVMGGRAVRSSVGVQRDEKRGEYAFDQGSSAR